MEIKTENLERAVHNTQAGEHFARYKEFQKSGTTKEMDSVNFSQKYDAISVNGDTVEISKDARVLKNLTSVPDWKLKQLYHNKEISKINYDREMKRRSKKQAN